MEYIKTNIVQNLNIIELAGDIFEDEHSHLVHYVSRELTLKEGLALEFRRRFGNLESNQNKKVTDLVYFKKGNRYIIYMILSEKEKSPITYENMYNCLQNLKIFCLNNQITDLAVSKTGDQIFQLDWATVRIMIRYLFKGTSIKIKIFTPNELTDQEKRIIIKEMHENPLAGHRGISNTIKKIKKRYNWPRMSREVTDYVQKCQSCQKNKTSNKHTKQPMVITSTADKPFQKIFMDIVGPLPITHKGNKYVLTMQDDLTKFSIATPMVCHEANTVAHSFVNSFVCIHGIPESIVSDQGTEFLSKIFSEVCKLLKISKFNTTPYRPQSNGALERSHSTLGNYLRHYVDKDLANWDEFIPYAMYVYNTTEHDTTKFQPYELLYGFPGKIPTSLKKTPEPRYNYEDYNYEIKQKFQQSYEIAKQRIVNTKESTKGRYDNKINPLRLKINDKVWLMEKQQKNKLAQKWLGPYVITEINNNENVTIMRGKKLVKVHRNLLKLCNQ